MPNIQWSAAFIALLASQPALSIDVKWHAPKSTDINNANKVLNGTGTYGFIFDSSDTPNKDYGKYNWCNMPHVRSREYPKAQRGYELQYVEVSMLQSDEFSADTFQVHRHHKRTPYGSNVFPEEAYPWGCEDQGLYYYGEPIHGKHSAQTYWKGYQNPITPFKVPGFRGSCNFPQITKEGLDDSWQHGRDLYRVYHDQLRFLPRRLDPKRVSFRVTNNVITSQVAGMLVNGMYGTTGNVPLDVESPSIDSLEPKYSCPRSRSTFSDAKKAPNTKWSDVLTRSKDLFAKLDAVSGVPESASDWHDSYDHYFDNLSARLCHAKPLPCNIEDPSKCITRDQADTIFRLGQFEYSYVYRDSPTSLAASSSSIGIWLAEVAQHLRDQIAGKDGKMLYRHNVAHDGSISRILSVLQLDEMVWPGMGSEVVFELYTKKSGKWGQKKEHFVRVLFNGQVLRSSNPDLGKMDMIPVSTLLGYFDGLVGKKGNLVPGLCETGTQ
ncbi:hypothetical protein FQN57_005999 [Myotisia sp. PD_48]|nr:hypothetical protein FQN57_005999 [Myotisia sp. PD_48]